MRGKVFGYARCSTSEKRQDIERQVSELYGMGAHTVVQEYESGGLVERERFAELIAAIGDGDTLVATEVSRVTRSVLHLCEVIELAKAKNLLLKFGSLDFDFLDGKIDAFKLAMLQIMGVFSELERNLTSDRINSGLAQAKSKGVKLGRPPLTAACVPVNVRDYFGSYLDGNITVSEFAKLTGLSRPTIYKYIKLLRREQGV